MATSHDGNITRWHRHITSRAAQNGERWKFLGKSGSGRKSWSLEEKHRKSENYQIFFGNSIKQYLSVNFEQPQEIWQFLLLVNLKKEKEEVKTSPDGQATCSEEAPKEAPGKERARSFPDGQ